MSFEENLRKRINTATFGSDERNLLKVVLGDIQLKASSGKVTDEMCHGIVKKLIKGNDESLGYLAADDTRRVKYIEENRVLATLLPTYLTLDEIKARLEDPEVTASIKAAKSDGQAVGVAMGCLKKLNLAVDGETVKQAVALIRT